jgi:hypothetical protein
LPHPIDHGHFVAILKVASDAGQGHPHLDTALLEHRRIADTGEHQQLRSIERTAGEDHLAARTRNARFGSGGTGGRVRGIESLPFLIFDADGASPVEEDTRGEGVELDPQSIGILPCDCEKPLARPHPPMIVRRQRRVARTNLVAGDHAPVVRIAERFEP